MQLVNPSQAFSFNYTAYDQASNLFVAFSIYDVTTGTAVFLAKVLSTYSAFGSYMASYTSVASKSYLVIGVVYTDNTYSTADLTRAPTSNLYQALGGSGTLSYLCFAYSAFDQQSGLPVQAMVYNMTSGSPVSVGTAAMTYVAFGTYFGSYVGTSGNSYDVLGVVYTDGTFTVPDTSRAPSSDEFDCISLNAYYNYFTGAPTLVGQSLNATLVES